MSTEIFVAITGMKCTKNLLEGYFLEGLEWEPLQHKY